MTAELVEYRCDEAEARALTDAIKEGVEKTYRRLLQAHRWRAWSALGYASWRDYAQAEFGIGQSRAYQLLDQARVVEEIEQAVSTSVELTEAQVRDLKSHVPAVIDAVLAATAGVPDDEKPAAAAEAIREARAHVTTTTRTTEASKVEQDVDLHTGEILSDEPGSITKLTGHSSASDPTPEPDPVGDFLASSQAVQDANYVHNFVKAFARADDFLGFDVERLAVLMDDAEVASLQRHVTAVAQFCESISRARRGLRLVKG